MRSHGNFLRGFPDNRKAGLKTDKNDIQSYIGDTSSLILMSK